MNGRRVETTTRRPPLVVVEEISADVNPFPGDMRRLLIHFLVVERACAMQPNPCWDTESIAVPTPKILAQIDAMGLIGIQKAVFCRVLDDS